MDYFNIGWPRTISQKGSEEVALLLSWRGRFLGAFKVEARMACNWDGKWHRTGPCCYVGLRIHSCTVAAVWILFYWTTAQRTLSIFKSKQHFRIAFL